MSVYNQIPSEETSIFAVKKEMDEHDSRDDFVHREKFIGLLLGEEQFLLPITAVSEIMMLPPITYIPQAPQFIEGVINLRGTILPAINLRKMLGMTRAGPTMSTRIIICRHSDLVVGLLVDGITSVESLLPSEIEDNSMGTGGVQGVETLGRLSKKNERVRGVFDLEKVLIAVGGERLFSVEETPDVASH